MCEARFWLRSRLLLPYRITEELPVTRPEIQTSYSRCEWRNVSVSRELLLAFGFGFRLM
jgi:hypothetical protein